jgi:DNA-binding GntR family transcriptional regulator
MTARTAPELTEPAADRALLGRAGTAERVAAALRERITQGLYRPGTRLSEEQIGRTLGVSRNTLREAFRLLTHERLLVHRLNRGTFVRVLDAGDIADIYHVRHLVECAALRGLGAPPHALGAIREAVCDGQEAARRGDWTACGTADIHFHQAIAALAGSRRTDDLMRGVLAELRLAFHVMDDPRRFHEPYLTRNRDILAALESGDAEGAERLLGFYLEDSRRQLTEAYPAQP